MKSKIETKIIRSNRRSLAMKILPDSTLVVKAPFLLPKFMIDKFIRDNWDWVEKHQAKQKIKAVKKKYEDGETFLFLGEKLTLKIGDYVNILYRENELLIPKFMEFRIEKEIKEWLIKQSKKIILGQLAKYAKEMDVKHGQIMFSDTQSKWGTCFADNRLQFNFRLVMAPIFVINYVIVHELSHTIEKNHSYKFWSIVRKFNPSYRQQIKWLKLNGESLKL